MDVEAKARKPRSKKSAEWLGWYFTDKKETLRYGDGRKIEVGATHAVDAEPVLCERGLHASRSVLEALEYAPGSVLWRVRLSGKRVDSTDKSCATERTYLARLDAEPLLREFARKCALEVIHLWDAPRIVRDYLKTGDDTLRAAARAAAWAASDAARAAAWAASDAARAAAWAARDAAMDAARAAASAAARAARDAARDATWAARAAAMDAARAAQKTLLEKMALDAIKQAESA